MKIQEVKKLSISSQISLQLRKMILNGEITSGTKLPPERELAAQFGTNRNTLREAIRILEEEGLVKVRQGGGMMVQDWRKNGSIGLLPHVMLLMDGTDEKLGFMRDALKIRRMALGLVARMAAENLSEEHHNDLDEAMGRVKKALDGNDDPVEADINFYQTLVSIGGSMVLSWLTNTVITITRQVAQEARSLWVIDQSYVDGLENVCDAVCSKDPDKAQQALERHLEHSDSVVENLLKGGLYE